MKVQDLMSREVRVANPEETIRHAAQTMREIDSGILPVGENDRLVGMITDRDIAVRAVAEGLAPDTRVRQVMSNDICYCFSDQEVSDVAANMADIQVRRLPVVDRDKRLVGIFSLADIALADSQKDAASDALCGISEPGGKHSQANGSA